MSRYKITTNAQAVIVVEAEDEQTAIDIAHTILTAEPERFEITDGDWTNALAIDIGTKPGWAARTGGRK